MSAASIILAALKRPATWLLGVIGTVATTFATNIFTPVETYLSEKISPYYCEIRQYGRKPISDESQFNILVSRLAGDPWLSHRDRIMRAFLSEEGFRVIPVCESFNIDYSKDSQSARDETRLRAMDFIKFRNADLLLFGEFNDQDKAFIIYTMNVHGGCDFRPKPTKLDYGADQDDFTKEEKQILLEASLREIESACLNQLSYDWPVFASRMKKIEKVLNQFDFGQSKFLGLASAYIRAIGLLYKNRQGDVWFSKGEEFAKRIINKFEDNAQGAGEARSEVYAEYAVLLHARFDKTKDKTNLEDPIRAADMAISLDPKNAIAYRIRADAYLANHEWDSAIADYNKVIEIDPKATPKSTICACSNAYAARGDAYARKGDWERAVKDYNTAIDHYSQAIRLDDKNAASWNGLCWRRAIIGQLPEALSACNQSLKLDPNSPDTLDSRGFVYLKMGKLEDAITDYDKAFGIDRSLASSLYGRGVAKLMNGDTDSGNSDVESANGIQPDIADKFQRYGIQLK